MDVHFGSAYHPAKSVHRPLPLGSGAERANCGTPPAGRFCSACGEQLEGRDDLSLRRFAAESAEVLTNADSTVIRTFRALIFGPGLLTVEYFAGRRRSYLRPLQVFLFANVFFFFAQSHLGFNILSTPLRTHTSMGVYGGLARRMVERAVAADRLSAAEYELVFDTTLDGLARTLVILFVPLLAVAVGVLYARGRRYFVEHLVFAMHAMAFLLIFIPPVVWILIQGLKVAFRFGTDEATLGTIFDLNPLLFLGWATYLFFALGRVYREQWWATALKTTALMIVFIPMLQVYRFALFLITYYTI